MLARIRVRNATVADRKADLASASPSLAKVFGHLVQESVGISLVLAGIGLILTLVLMPIGLPLALVGVALLAAPSDL
jgi:hypothetical protein